MYAITKFMTAGTLVALTIGVPVASAQDRATVVPDMQSCSRTNACVSSITTWRSARRPRCTLHPNYIVYRFKPTKARITLADGSQRKGERKAGEVTWEKATTHSVENLGDTDIHNLIVELKPEAILRLTRFALRTHGVLRLGPPGA